ncbi:MAG: hypothetical protein VKL42_13675 [Snowella sp.]|nr:hypothetical protein [Snowella sp.]
MTSSSWGLSMGLFLVILEGIFPLPSHSQISQAIVQEIIDSDQVFIQEKPAKVDDKANFGDVVLTQQARASLLFNNGAAGRLGNNAKVTVGQCVEVERGELLISGPVNGCMGGLSVAVKGTLYILKKTDQGSGSVQVLEGTVQVSNKNQPAEKIEVSAGEKIELLQGVLGSVIPMTSEEIRALLSGKLFSDFHIPITPDSALQQVCSRLLPGLSCSSTGLPSYPIPTPSLPISVPGLPF